MSTVDSQVPLNATAAALIGLLDECGPANANALWRRATEVIGDYWSVTRSQVYREVGALEAMGYVAAGPPGPRSSRAYRPTAAGTAALARWLDAGPTGDVVRVPLLLTIRFGGCVPATRLREVIDDFARRHELTRATYAQRDAARIPAATAADPYQAATLRFGRLFETAVQTWLEELPDLLPVVFHDPLPRATPAAPRDDDR